MAQSIFPGHPTLDPATSRLIGTFEIPVYESCAPPDPGALGSGSGKYTWLAVPDVALVHNYGLIVVWTYDDAGHAPDAFYFWTISDGVPDPRAYLDLGPYAPPDAAPCAEPVGQRLTEGFPYLQPIFDQDHDNPAIAEGQTYFQTSIIVNPSGGVLPATDVTLKLGSGALNWVTVDGAAVLQEAPPPGGSVTLYEWWPADTPPTPVVPPAPCIHPPWPYTDPYVAAAPGPAGVVRL